jgi:glyceraldehyde 3-phosphate dehydrogenase
MPTRVAINGFGRIGRAVLRSTVERGADLDIVAVNDITDPSVMAQLLACDSVYGRFDAPISADAETLFVADRAIRALRETDPAALPWAEMEVDAVIESTGLFRTRAAAARHLEAGARKVILSAPAKGSEPADANVVLGSTSTAPTTRRATTSSPTRRARRTASRRSRRSCTRPSASATA